MLRGKTTHSVDQGVSSEERRHRTASMTIMVLGRMLELFPRVPLQNLGLQTTSRYRPIAFDPEGSPLDCRFQ